MSIKRGRGSSSYRYSSPYHFLILAFLIIILGYVALKAGDGFTGAVTVQNFTQPQCDAADPDTTIAFNDACDNTYPGTALFDDDTTYESAAISAGAPWAGVRINSSNRTIASCGVVYNVSLCFKWFRQGGSVINCNVSIDANGGNSYTGVDGTCPDTTEPSVKTCVDVTGNESWSCNNFFGSDASGALIRSEVFRSGASPTINWDVLYFNVSYSEGQKYTCGQFVNGSSSSAYNHIVNGSGQPCADNGLQVSVSNVDFSCGGANISGDGSGDGLVIASATDQLNITIRNCNINGFYQGVNIFNNSFKGNLTLINVSFFNNTIDIFDNESGGNQKVIIINNTFGQAHWNISNLTATRFREGDGYYLRQNLIGLDASNLLNFNYSAELIFKNINVSPSSPFSLRNNITCGDYCTTVYSLGNNEYTFNVTSFSNYSLNLSDNDADGFNISVDCDDNDATLRPLTNDTENNITTSIRICPGDYAASINVRANNMYVDGGGVRLAVPGTLGLFCVTGCSTVILNGNLSTSPPSGGFDNVTIRHFLSIEWNGIRLANAENITVYNNTFSYLNPTVIAIEIDNSTMGVNITDNHIVNAQQGVLLNGSSTPAHTVNVHIDGNSITSSSHALELHRADNGSMASNNLTTSDGGSGISLNNGENMNLSFNVIRTNTTGGHGIVFNVYNHSILLSSNISVSGSSSYGLLLNLSSRNNLFYNNNITALKDYDIYDRSGSATTNALIYNTSWIQVNWSKTNLTTNTTLIVGITLNFSHNNLQMGNDSLLQNLNTTFQLLIRNLSYTSTPQLLKKGQRCDNTVWCNISYDADTKVLSGNISGFGSYKTRGVLTAAGTIADNAIITQEIQATGTAFTFNRSGFELDCDGFRINYSSGGTAGHGVNNSGGFDNFVIKNCNFVQTGAATDGHGMYLENAGNITLHNVSFHTIGSQSYGLYLLGNSGGNIFINANISPNASFSIYDNHTGDTNSIIYNNSFGEINWTRANLTTNVSLELGSTIFVQNNLLGLMENSQSLNLNGTAKLEITGVSSSLEPYLLRNGERCDNGISCNITYNRTTQILSANVSSFSNYSAFPRQSSSDTPASSASSAAASGSSLPPAPPPVEAVAVSTITTVEEARASLSVESSGSSLTLFNKGNKTIVLNASIEKLLALENEARIRELLESQFGIDEAQEKIEVITLIENEGVQSLLGLVTSFTTLFFTHELNLDGVQYSGHPIAGRLLKSSLFLPEELIIPPGGELKKDFEIQGGLGVKPKKIKVIFSTAGETVTEKDIVVERQVVIGSAVDVDATRNLIDLYVLIPLAEENSSASSRYSVEFSLNTHTGKEATLLRGETRYSDLFGPYVIPAQEALMFGQQFEYNENIYQGELVAEVNIWKDGSLVVRSEFPVTLG